MEQSSGLREILRGVYGYLVLHLDDIYSKVIEGGMTVPIMNWINTRESKIGKEWGFTTFIYLGVPGESHFYHIGIHVSLKRRDSERMKRETTDFLLWKTGCSIV